MSFTCNICSKAFTLKNNLKRHIASAHSNESYEYAICKKLFQRKDSLRRHRLAVHDKMIELKSSEFGKTFARVHNFRRHQKICCRCKQSSKQFESVRSLKEYNCTKLEKVPNLFRDKEKNFTNLDDLETVSRNEQTSSSEVNKRLKIC